jgi:MFS family permease
MKTSRIPRPVWFLGWSSLFTDAATEMIYPLLPVYLSRVLGAGAMSLGIIEGVAEAINSFLKIASGYVSDRWPRRRPIVILGYSISSLARPLIGFTSTWTQVLAIRSLDRTGKGIRGAPRDAMLARLATPETRGRIYGFHRAMDHTGAIIGPVVATAILFFAPERYRLVFGLTIIPGALAVAMLFLVAEPEPEAKRSVETRDAHRAEGLPRRLFIFLGVLLVFTLGNSADAFLLLRLGTVLGSVTWVPLLWAALHVVKASLSTWGGALSDRVGRRWVIVMGWSVFAIVYLGFARAESAAALIAWFLTYGIYFALAEGTEKALVADLAPQSKRGLAFGVYNATLGVGALAASVGFGFVYQRFGAPMAFGIGAALAGVATVMLMLMPDAMMRNSDETNSRH